MRDETPTFTLYRMRFTDAAGAARDLVGVLGGLEVVDEGAGGVLPHERTTPKASTDRLDLTRATNANLSPVWGLSLATGLTALLAAPGEPVGAVTVDGVEHVVERVTDPDRIAAIRAHLATDDVLIADGHHRYGVSRIHRDDVRAATGRTDTAAEETLAFVGELVAEQLSIEAIHRLYSSIPFSSLRAALATHFDLSATGYPDPGHAGRDGGRGSPRADRPGRGRVADAAPGRVRRGAGARRRVAGDGARRHRRRGHVSARPRRGARRGRRPARQRPPC